MANQVMTKTTGLTPEVEAGVGQVVEAFVEVRVVKTRMIDGYGEKIEGYAFIDEAEVRFIDMKAISKPVQGWAEQELRKRLGLTDFVKKAESSASATKK